MPARSKQRASARTLPQAEGGSEDKSVISPKAIFVSASARPHVQLAHALRPEAPTSQSSLAGRFNISSSVSKASSSTSSSLPSLVTAQLGAAGGATPRLRSEKEAPACQSEVSAERKAV